MLRKIPHIKILKNKYLTPVLIMPALIVIIVCSVSCGIANNLFMSGRTSDDTGINELLDTISDRYIGTYEENDILIDAKRAIVNSLDDQWSYYLTAEEYQNYLESSENSYQGIGVVVSLDEENAGILVMRVYKNSGAYNAGIVDGDIITHVDTVSLRGMSMDDVREALRRPLGDTAMLTVLRSGGQIIDIEVEYCLVFQDPVSYEMLGGNIGYIYLANFEGGAAGAFISAMEDLISQGAIAFIYDVRHNFGGRVSEMCPILDYLLPEGEIFISLDKSGKENITKSDSAFIDLPAVVLVDSESYSGAEYFTATLSEYEYAIVVGEPTTGKNRMQQTIPLSDGSALHISTGMFLTPNRIDLYEQGGFEPDYIVTFTDEERQAFLYGTLAFEDDPQFQKALEIITQSELPD